MRALSLMLCGVLFAGCAAEIRHRIDNYELAGAYMGKKAGVACFVNRIKFAEPGWFRVQVSLINESRQRISWDTRKVNLMFEGYKRPYEEGGNFDVAAGDTKSFDFLFRTGPTLRDATLVMTGITVGDEEIEFDADIRSYEVD